MTVYAFPSLFYIFSYITTEAKDRDVNYLLSASNVLLCDRSRAVWIRLHRWSEQYRHCSGTQPSHIHYDKWTVDGKLAYSIRDILCTKCTPFMPFSKKAVIKRLWCINPKGLCWVNLFWSGKSLNLGPILFLFHTRFTLQIFYSAFSFLSLELWMANCEMQCSCSVQSVLACANTIIGAVLNHSCYIFLNVHLRIFWKYRRYTNRASECLTYLIKP